MCGICCIYGSHDYTTNAKCMGNQSRLSRRGPDISDCKMVTVNKDKTLTMIGHVLHLRGQLTPQPLSDGYGNILLWNGEVFDGIEITEDENDTEVLLKFLSKSSDTGHIIHVMSQIQGPWAFIYWQERTKSLWFGRDVFGRRSLLWHLPDSSQNNFILSSTHIADDDFKEIPSVGLFCVTFPESCDSDKYGLDIHLYPWHRAVWPGTMDKVDANELKDRLYPGFSNESVKMSLDTEQHVPSQMPVLNKEIPHSGFSKNEKEGHNPQHYIQDIIQDDVDLNRLSDQLIQVLQMAVYKRVYNQPALKRSTLNEPCLNCGGNFSRSSFNISRNTRQNSDNSDDRHFECQQNSSLSAGNMNTNCMVRDPKHAFTKDQQTLEINYEVEDKSLVERSDSSVTEDERSENVISESCYTVKDLSVANDQIEKVKDNSVDSVTELSMPDCKKSETVKPKPGTLNPFETLTSPVLDMERSGLQAASSSDNSHLSAISTQEDQRSAKVAILFSGGIDSAVITALVDRCLPLDEPVDLLNVAFEKQNRQNNSKGQVQNKEDGWNVPDRQTGYSALSELNPNRKWNFVLVNVTLEELKRVRSEHVRHLVYPLDTVLDDSIGCAVWFAARGQGILGNGDRIGQSYTSKAKVILCGMGADEQLAGYARHRRKYQESGWPGLVEEIDLEVSRISARNLGRDDRIITDHGKESRFPFLDENVVSFLSQLPVYHKANLDLPRGLGEKLLLRVSATKLGLTNTAVLPKRAIQFGSRIAKIENSKEKATDKCNRLTE